MKQPMTNGSESNRAAAYIRSAGESPETKETCLDGQREEISGWCREHGHELVACYIEEAPAGSDRVKGRPALTSLLEDAKAGQFDTVVVVSLDRWARSVGVQCQTLRILSEAQIGFATVREGFNLAAPSDRLLFAIMQWMDEWHRASLKKRRTGHD